MSDGFPDHGFQVGVVGNVGEFHDERAIADFVFHGFRDFPHQMRVVAQQAIVTFVGAAGVHFHQSGSGFRNQMRGGDMVGDVRLAVHAVHAGTLEAGHEQLPVAGGGDRLLHVRLPFVGVTRRHAETVGDRNRKLISGVGKHAFIQFGAAGNQRPVCVLRMHGEHVREGVATPRAGADRLVHRQIETHAEGGGGEPLVQQRTGGNAKRQVHAEAEEFLGLVGRLRLGGLCRLRGGAGSGIALHHFGERTERPLQIVVFIRAIDVVKRRETLAHTAPRNCSRVMFWICDANTRNVMSTVTRHTSRLHAPSHLGNLLG